MNSAVLICAIQFVFASCLNFKYLDPKQLQTATTAKTQELAATRVIHKYDKNKIVRVHINATLFQDSKDVFIIYTEAETLNINASSGVAAVWGYNYFLKKYYNSTIGWTEIGMYHKHDIILKEIQNITEKVVATVRFRYFGNSNAFSYNSVWWDEQKWMKHVDWMALNGINVALVPVAQEAAWSRVYRTLGMTQDQIDQYSTGPAYLPFHRMGKLRGWGGPLPKSWHQRQIEIQKTITTYTIDLGMVPVFPTFNGHVPQELSDLFSWKSMRYNNSWIRFGNSKHCCDIFMDPDDPLFERMGKMFLNEITNGSPITHLYYAAPFYQIETNGLTTKTTQAIFSTLTDFDDRAVLIVQNTVWESESTRWADHIVESVLTAVPKGRMIILDKMLQKDSDNKTCTVFHGQPYIWSVDTQKINWGVHEAIDEPNNTIVGLGVSPCVMEQNHMLVEWVLEAAWRSKRLSLPEWQQQYAARRYGCNATASAWGHLLNSVYKGYIMNHDIITSRPSLTLYGVYSLFPSYELFEAWRKFVFVSDDECRSPAFEYDLIDVTRQALYYRVLQVYINLQRSINFDLINFRYMSIQFVDLLKNIGYLLNSNDAFTLEEWLTGAKNMSSNPEEAYLYNFNSRSIYMSLLPFPYTHTDTHRAELYLDLYVPRWNLYLDLTNRRMKSDSVLKNVVEQDFFTKNFQRPEKMYTRSFVRELYKKYAFMPYLEDLPIYKETDINRR